MSKSLGKIDQSKVGFLERHVSGFIVLEMLAQIINGLFFLPYIVMFS